MRIRSVDEQHMKTPCLLRWSCSDLLLPPSRRILLTYSRHPGSVPPSVHQNNIIGTYSRCSLTNPADKTIALASVVKTFREHTDDYLAGPWGGNMES